MMRLGVIARSRPKWRGQLLAILTVIVVSTTALADAYNHSKTVEGLTAYLGLVPAEVVRGHAARHPEAQAHGGVPRGEHVYHVLVAVFDASNGARVENVGVTARVSGLGLVGPQRALEPMKIADTVTYGNYFNLPGRGRYRIDVEVERPQGAVRFEFTYDH